MRVRKRLKSDVFTYLLVLAIAVGAAAFWLNKHQRKLEQENTARVAELAKKKRVKVAIHLMQQTWKADDDWEGSLSPPGVTAPAYSLDVQHTLVRGQPILIFGTVDDVRSGGDGGEDLVLVDNDIYSKKINLHFSLSSSPELASFIATQSQNNELAQFETFACIANIQSVEKVEGRSSQEGDESDYFLAHGTLRAAYPTHIFELNPKEVLGN